MTEGYWKITVLEHLIFRQSGLVLQCSKRKKGGDCAHCLHREPHGMMSGCENSCNAEGHHWCFPVEPIVVVDFEEAL